MTDLIRRIQEALDTDEEGDALIDIARKAHRAEQKLAVILHEMKKLAVILHAMDDGVDK